MGGCILLRLSIILIAALWAGFLIWGAPTAPTAQSDQNMRNGTTRTASVTNYAVPTILAVDRPTLAAKQTTTRAAPLPILAVQIATAPTPPLDTAPAEELPLFTVTGTRVNLRAGPSTDTDVVMSLSLGSVTEALGAENEGWIKIRDLNTGLSGYMSARFLELL